MQVLLYSCLTIAYHKWFGQGTWYVRRQIAYDLLSNLLMGSTREMDCLNRHLWVLTPRPVKAPMTYLSPLKMEILNSSDTNYYKLLWVWISNFYVEILYTLISQSLGWYTFLLQQFITVNKPVHFATNRCCFVLAVFINIITKQFIFYHFLMPVHKLKIVMDSYHYIQQTALKICYNLLKMVKLCEMYFFSFNSFLWSVILSVV